MSAELFFDRLTWFMIPGFQIIDQAAEHSRDFFEHGLQLFMVLGCQYLPAKCQFHQRDTFLRGTSIDSEGVAAVGFRETSVAFGDVGGSGE